MLKCKECIYKTVMSFAYGIPLELQIVDKPCVKHKVGIKIFRKHIKK